MLTKRQRRLIARQEAMKKTNPVRPWTYRKLEDDADSRLRLEKMFEAGRDDELIANAFSMRVQAVKFLREVWLGSPKYLQRCQEVRTVSATPFKTP
jgi:hypothetical protein